MSVKSIGQVAFEAAKSLPGVLPGIHTWSELTRSMRSDWEVMAEAVKAAVLERDDACRGHDWAYTAQVIRVQGGEYVKLECRRCSGVKLVQI